MAIDLELGRRPTTRYSLGPTVTQQFLVFFIAGPGLMAVTLKAFPAAWYGPKGVGLGVVHLLFAVAVIMVYASRVRKAERAWIDNLDLPLDRGAYLDALNASGTAGRLAVRVDVDGAAAPNVAALPGATVETGEGHVRIISPVMPMTRFTPVGLLHVHNGRFHRWFRDCVDKVLRPMAATTQIKKVVPEVVQAK